jgi:hypothetical protein
MIFNPTTKEYEGQNLRPNYAPLDSKYLHSQPEDSVVDQHQNSLSSHDDMKTFDGYGLEQLMSQRQEINNSRTQMLFSEIYLRHRLKDENIYRICLDQCTCRSLIYRTGENHLDKMTADLERKIIDLEQEKRREITSCFKDLLFLSKELRESMIMKLEEEQKSALLTN